ncbi:MAG: type IV toxin-antitoxin system AbiEi family antitoxin domain-containing protein [Actinomycetota bacterium]
MRTCMGAGCEKRPDALAARTAARQHGVLTRTQILDAGLTKSMLHRRVRQGRFVRIHPGVYCVAGAPHTFEQRCFAAAAWGGADAVVSHATAAHLWRLVDTTPPACDVSCRRKRTRPPDGVRAHFATDLRPRDRGKLRNVPVTSPARTLIDVAGALPESQVEKALHVAIHTGCVNAALLRERVARARRGSHGPALLRRLLRERGSFAHVQSPLERSVAAALTGGDLPPFSREYPVYAGGQVFYLDFAWPHFGVGVEADGRRWHSDPRAFESDRTRQNALAAAGWRILRVTDRQIAETPDLIRVQVGRLLAGARA